MAEPIFDRLVALAPGGWQVESLHFGANWTFVFVRDPAGLLRAGLAGTPTRALAAHPTYRPGANRPETVEATRLLAQARGPERLARTIGLAVLNAMQAPDPTLVQPFDAGDWLATASAGRQVALIGRFPFVDEIRPVAARLWVFEQRPQKGEHGRAEMPALLPRADILAITASTLANGSLDGILPLAAREAAVLVLGPSTPLAPALWDVGVDMLAGVQVVDAEAVLADVVAGVTFRRMRGVRRVGLWRPGFTPDRW